MSRRHRHLKRLRTRRVGLVTGDCDEDDASLVRSICRVAADAAQKSSLYLGLERAARMLSSAYADAVWNKVVPDALHGEFIYARREHGEVVTVDLSMVELSLVAALAPMPDDTNLED